MPHPKQRLDWSETAGREFIDGIDFIAEDSPHGASLVRARIDRAAGQAEQAVMAGMGIRLKPLTRRSALRAFWLDHLIVGGRFRISSGWFDALRLAGFKHYGW